MCAPRRGLCQPFANADSRDTSPLAATLKRDLGVNSLILTVVTGTIGSGWLFAPYFCAPSPAQQACWPGRSVE